MNFAYWSAGILDKYGKTPALQAYLMTMLRHIYDTSYVWARTKVSALHGVTNEIPTPCTEDCIKQYRQSSVNKSIFDNQGLIEQTLIISQEQ